MPQNHDEAGGPQRWSARPWAARAIKVAAFVAPIVISILVSLAISRRIETPTTRLGQIGLWIVLSLIATAILFVLDKVSRRLLPLSTLFGLSLIFPDEAPSRFRTALRSGTVNQLKRRIDEAKAHGLSDDPSVAAETLVELAGALSIHDRLTRGHSERVRAYTKLIAEELDLSEDEIDRLQWAGLAHDVGKLFVPTEILNKPGRLTDEEYEIIKSHTVHGAELVAPLRDWLGDALDGVDQHHERWDGNGYPYGLARTDISLAGRIVAVADVFDVITSVRSYKQAHAVTAAREELVRCSGTQFDPRVVRAFLNIGLGRLRLLVGPLSWLAQVPVIARAPVGAAAAPTVATLGTALSLAFGGFFAGDVQAVVPADEVVAVAAPRLETTTSTTTTTVPPITTPTTTTASTTTSTAPTTTTTVPTTTTVVEPVAAPTGPATAADVAEISEDASGPVVIDVLANDTAADGGTLSILGVGSTELGTVTTDGTTIAFTPAPNKSGTATIPYTIIDDRRRVSVGTLTIRLLPVNDAPTAVDDRLVMAEDAPARTLAVLANDFDIDGDPLTVSAVSASALGTATTDGTSVRFAPAADANGTETLTYTIRDDSGATATASIAVTVTPVNDAPTLALGAAPSVPEDSPAQTFVGWATTGPGGGPDESGQSVTATTTTADASLFSSLPALDPATGTLTFTAAPDANGSTLVTISVGDSAGASTTATFTITLTAVNDAPVAGDDTTTITEDDPATAIAVLTNDTDIDGDPLTITTVTGATLGTATTDGTTITYTPNPDANGTDTLTYTADDSNGGTDTATLTITITPVDDAPTLALGAAPSAPEDSPAQTLTGWATTSPGGGPDENTQTLTATLTATTPSLFSTQPALDPTTGDLTYTPAADANGSSLVTIDLDDGTNTTTATFTITLTAVNDAPVAGDDTTTITEDDPATAIAVLTNDTDIDGDPLTITTVTGATLGTATTDGTTITYTPNPDANGTDTLTYTADDSNGGTDTATLTITITPDNDAPVATGEAYTTDRGVDLVVPAPGLLGNDGDADGDALTVSTTPATPPASGTVILGADGSFTYSPSSPTFSGTDSFTYTVDDGNGGTDTATATVLVEDGLATARYYLGSSGSSPTTFALNTSPGPPAAIEPDYFGDFDGDPGFTIENSNGSLTETDPRKYQHWTLASATPITLKGPVDLDLWSTVADFEADEDLDYWIWLHDCATDGTDCQLLTSVEDVKVGNWNGGATTWVNRVLPAGSIDHTLLPGRILRMRLMVDREDLWVALSGTRPSAVDLTLANASPAAADDATTVLEDAATTTLDVLANDVDLNLDPTTVRIATPATKGTATARGDGRIDYTPSTDENGADTFVYEVCDTGGLCDTATVAVTITPVNDAPSFQAGGPASADEDDGTTNVDDWATIIVAGPTDEIATQTVWFEVSNDNPALFGEQPAVDPDGKLTFKGADDAFGTATVTVVMRDDGGTTDGGVDTSAPATFVITISNVNDPPAAADDAATVAEDAAPTAISVLANDVDIDGDTLTITSVTGASLGTATTDGTTITYTPNLDANGTDTIGYTVDDGNGETDTARLTVTITPVNDAPAFAIGPNVNGTAGSGAQTIAGWVSGISPGPGEGGQSVTFEVTVDLPGLFTVDPAVAPDGSLTYTPLAAGGGTATVSVVAVDDGGTVGGGIDRSAAQTATITIAGTGNTPPVAVDDSALTNTLLPVNVNYKPNDTDADGDEMTLVSFTQPANGVVTPNAGGTLRYTSVTNFWGVDTFEYTITDGRGGFDTATVTVTVNSVPVAVADVFAVGAGPTVLNVTANDFDLDGDPLTIQAADTALTNGSVTCGATTCNYNPGSFRGVDTFRYRLRDTRGGTSAWVTVTITVA